MTEQPAITAQDLIALSLVPKAGRQTVRRAIQLSRRMDTPLSALFGLPARDLLPIAVPGEEAAVQAIERCGNAEQERAETALAHCARAGIRYWTCLDPEYPPFLAEALGTQAPPLLFFQGNEALLQVQGAGIVGRRRPTEEGADWAGQAARLFAGEGITVVSGGASGIDMAAHRAALTADGTTVVILPEGHLPHHPHPAIRTGLDNGQVLLLSEFLPSHDWQTHRAMTRNRTIAACSRLVCVVEPRPSGGSMFTARQALAAAKPVFYWGGACRDGALRDQAGARPLVTGGTLQRARLLHAACHKGLARDGQADLFDAP